MYHIGMNSILNSIFMLFNATSDSSISYVISCWKKPDCKGPQKISHPTERGSAVRQDVVAHNLSGQPCPLPLFKKSICLNPFSMFPDSIPPTAFCSLPKSAWLGGILSDVPKLPLLQSEPFLLPQLLLTGWVLKSQLVTLCWTPSTLSMPFLHWAGQRRSQLSK